MDVPRFSFDPMCLGVRCRTVKNHRMKILSLSLLALALSSKTVLAFPTETLFVVMGGYTSCGKGNPEPAGIGMYQPFMKMLESARKTDPNMKFHYLISCFNSDAPPTGPTKYIISTEPGRVLKGNATVLMNEIERIADGKEISVFIAGHSYGGYQAMYLAQKLKLSSKIQGLYTVDPIGPSCNAFQVIMGGKACKSAPTDLNNKLIQENVVAWQNFYQNQDTWLHSGPIAEAVNMHVKYRGPHTQIDSDDRTWTSIGTSVLTVVKANLNPPPTP